MTLIKTKQGSQRVISTSPAGSTQARWDKEKEVLVESLPKVLYTLAPIIWMKPITDEGKEVEGTYECPTYKTSERRGMLSTTGHSTNFVMMIQIPAEEGSSSKWIKAGVAALTQLDD